MEQVLPWVFPSGPSIRSLSRVQASWPFLTLSRYLLHNSCQMRKELRIRLLNIKKKSSYYHFEKYFMTQNNRCIMTQKVYIKQDAFQKSRSYIIWNIIVLLLFIREISIQFKCYSKLDTVGNIKKMDLLYLF